MTLHRLNTSFANVLPLQRGDYNVANKTRDAGACMRKDTSQKIHPKKNGVRRSGQSSDVVGRGVATPRMAKFRVVRQTVVRANNFHPADRGRTANRARQNIPQ